VRKKASCSPINIKKTQNLALRNRKTTFKDLGINMVGYGAVMFPGKLFPKRQKVTLTKE